MKKLLILALIALLVTLSIFIVFKGLNIGGLTVLSITGVKQKNEDLDKTILQATKLASTDYKKVVDDISSNINKLEKEKNNYEEMVILSTDEQVEIANQYQKYKIEYLWKQIGGHATSEGVTMKMDVISGTNTTNKTYNLKFTVTGSYIGITDFVYAIENDSTLGFKIEEFKMVPSTDNNSLQGTFVCKDIEIQDISQGNTGTTDQTNAEGQTQTNQENINTNTNTTNTSNTANSTNTTNSSTDVINSVQ